MTRCRKLPQNDNRHLLLVPASPPHLSTRWSSISALQSPCVLLDLPQTFFHHPLSDALIFSFPKCRASSSVFISCFDGGSYTSEGTACWLQNMANIFPMDVITGEILLPLVRSGCHRFLPSWAVPSFALLSMGFWHNSAVFLLAPLP